MLTLNQLRDYDNWIGQNPLMIKGAALFYGGWARVFPDSLPIWASRVRNYFNETPMELKRLDDFRGKTAADVANKNSVLDDPLSAKALSGDTYVDRGGRLWYEMHTAGTVYHYAGKVTRGKKAKAAVSPQAFIPVFKLVSPDGTDGSSEICIHNFQLHRGVLARGTRAIGEVGKWVNIRTKVVFDPIYRGSYNYSETISVGLEAHELRDVKPHVESETFYINPPIWSPLGKRRFPAADREGKALAA